MKNNEKENYYDDCVLEVESCFSEEDYEEISNKIQELYSEGKIKMDEYCELKDMHYDRNYLFTNGIDDEDWEEMKLFDPNLSDQ